MEEEGFLRVSVYRKEGLGFGVSDLWKRMVSYGLEFRKKVLLGFGV